MSKYTICIVIATHGRGKVTELRAEKKYTFRIILVLI